MPAPSNPAVKVTARAAARLRDGHVWVYRSDLEGAPDLPAASLVTVQDHRGKPLGTAFYSSSSQIALRLISREPVPDLAALVRQRVAAALAYRQRVIHDTDAYRLLFSEADGLPGLIADRFNDVISLQVLTQAANRDDVKDVVVEELEAAFHPAGIVERTEARIRELEQLPPAPAGPLHGDKTATVYTMNGVRFHYDALGGQKTGAFLDQRENYAAAAHHAHGQALDVFCYQGGFALHLAKTCESVTAVDSSRPALELADQNGELNKLDVEWIEANAFDLLRDYADAGRQYDTIVLDPPAFAKTRKTLDTALRGYKEINLRALKMLKPGGLLVTCSCSYHVSEADFLEVLAAASLDAHRPLRIIERRGPAKDHPVLLTVPETFYLKCVLAAV